MFVKCFEGCSREEENNFFVPAGKAQVVILKQ